MSTDDESFRALYAEMKEHLARTPTPEEVKILIFGSEDEVLKLLGRTEEKPNEV